MTGTVPLADFTWQPSSWRARPAAQQPPWPDATSLEAATDELRTMPPLVFAGEARTLRAALARVSRGEGFLLQAGDCAESFGEFSADNIRDKLKVILQMSVALTYSTGVPTVKVGRIAGQFAKPRSSATETRDDLTLPSYFGDSVNDFTFAEAARRPDPERLLRGYHQAASTLNLLRAFTKGGFADLERVHQWNLEFVASAHEGHRYDEIADGIERALRFMAACGIDLAAEMQLHEVDFYTSHEALLLEYEEALTRRDSISGDWYDCSAHLLWIGARTHQLDGAHVEFLSGVRNPIGLKVGTHVEPEELLGLCRRLDPTREPGRLVLVSRMGADRVAEQLPRLLRAVQSAGHPVVWACDPMHGNTFAHESGYKTRHFDAVMREVEQFFAVCRAEGVWPGGVHVELTGSDVTECLGGGDDLSGSDLERRYETRCDPRLNARQSLDLAFRLAELIQRTA
ncbi:MAG: class II 3-deoxy-7-phosphoheptulonate synthase [Actinomycetota bacterium]